jgi:hypothetical protein
MARPEDGLSASASGCSRFRASDADRDRVIDVLKVAFVQGRLTKDEFDARVGAALASRTYADLAAHTADIPVALIDVPSPRTSAPAPARPHMTRVVRSRARVVVAAGRRAGSFCLSAGGVGHPGWPVPSRNEAQDRAVGVWGSAAYVWSGEERPRVAGFSLDLSGRQRVVGFPPA